MKYIILIAAGLFGLSGLANAKGLSPERFWKDHDEATSMLIHAWIEEAGPKAYGQAIYRLARSETYLVNKDVAYVKDPRMLMRLANSDGFRMNNQYDYSRFGYRVFAHEVGRRLGRNLSLQHLFRGHRFEIKEKQK